MSNKVIKDVLKIFNKGWNKQVILYGPPGTSKTYSSTIIAAAMLKLDKNDIEKLTFLGEDEDFSKILKEKLGGDESSNLYELASGFLKKEENKNRYKLVQFHPSYSYEDFVRGITVTPETKTENGKQVNTGNILYKVEPKIIEEFCDDYKKSGGSADNSLVLIIDEINRAPLASVLGELIYGLEYRGEKISTPYIIKDENDEKKDKDLVIPDNLFIIGTMNTADRSIGSMDYAVRRRFAFVQVGSESAAIEASWKDEGKTGEVAVELYEALINGKSEKNELKDIKGIFSYIADTEMEVEDIKIGHTYFLGKGEEGLEYLKYRVQYQILPIYQEYIKDGLIQKEGLNEFKKIVNDILNMEL